MKKNLPAFDCDSNPFTDFITQQHYNPLEISVTDFIVKLPTLLYHDNICSIVKMFEQFITYHTNYKIIDGHFVYKNLNRTIRYLILIK